MIALNLNELLRTLGVQFIEEGHHHCREGWIQTDCPFCGKHSKRFHLGWNIRHHYLNCWKCGHHRIVETLAEITGRPIREIKPVVDSLDSHVVFDERIKTNRLEMPKGIGPLQEGHIRYIKSRGLCPEHLEETWGIQGIGLSEKLPWRIFIPFHLQREIVSWTTRSIGEKGLRYISAAAEQEKVNHKTLLYGEDFCRHAVIVHEGPFDVWRTGPGAVATCGTGFSRHQLLRLANYPVRVICFDSEKPAQKRATELCDLFEPFPGETYQVKLDAKDAAEASDKEIKKLRGFLA